MALGFSFSPGSDIQMPRGKGAQPGIPRGMSPQQAVKILSLRVPEAMPSNAPINRSLLTSPGGAAAGASGLQSMIQQLIQSFKPAAGVPQTPMGAPSLAGPVTGVPVQQPAHAPVGMPPRVGPGGEGAPQPSMGMPVPSAPAPFQPHQFAPSPMLTPHIQWGDELEMGPAPPLALGQNPDEIEEWNRMLNLGPSGGLMPGMPWMQGR